MLVALRNLQVPNVEPTEIKEEAHTRAQIGSTGLQGDDLGKAHSHRHRVLPPSPCSVQCV